jgi:hypothetical protein
LNLVKEKTLDALNIRRDENAAEIATPAARSVENMHDSGKEHAWQ